MFWGFLFQMTAKLCSSHSGKPLDFVQEQWPRGCKGDRALSALGLASEGCSSLEKGGHATFQGQTMWIVFGLKKCWVLLSNLILILSPVYLIVFFFFSWNLSLAGIIFQVFLLMLSFYICAYIFFFISFVPGVILSVFISVQIKVLQNKSLLNFYDSDAGGPGPRTQRGFCRTSHEGP